MFAFRDPQYLYLLILAPILVGIYIWRALRARRHLARLGELGMLKALMPRRSTVRPHVKFTLLMLAFILLVVMLARPQYGKKQRQETTKGIEAVVMIDVSNSMLAADVRPNRLERAKLLVSNLLDRLKGDKIALGVFAGEAYPQMPITADYAAAKLFLDALNTDMVTLQGTNLGSAIELGVNSFTQSKDVGKAIIIITDGEDHEEGAIEAAKAAVKEGINIFVLGVGTTEGTEIYTEYGLFRDYAGNPVLTALNEDMCRDVAQAGKGIYLHLDGTSSAQEELQNQLSRLKQTASTTVYSARGEQFQALAILVLLLLILEILILETHNPFFKHFKLFKK